MVSMTSESRHSTPSIYRFINGMYNEMSDKFDLIKFTLGDPTEPVSPYLSDTGILHYFQDRGFEDGLFTGDQIRNAAKALGIDEKLLTPSARNYTAFQGGANYRQEIAEAFNDRHNTNYNANHFILTAGANGAMDLVIPILDGPVIVHEPGFGVYHGMFKKHNKEVITFDTTADGFAVKGGNGEKLDRVIEYAYQKALEKNVDLKREEFCFTFPFTDSGNPTGYKHSKEELESIRDLFLNKWKSGNVIADSLYFELAHEEERAVTLLDVSVGTDFEKMIVFVDSISKADSASSDRAGYAVCADDGIMVKIEGEKQKRIKENGLAEAAANGQLSGIVHPAEVSQAILKAALEHRDKYVGKNAAVYAEKTKVMRDVLEGENIIRYQPNGGFYTMMELEFMSKVPLSNATKDAAEQFYGKEEAQKIFSDNNQKVGNNPFLASLELAQRTGVFSVPYLPPKADNIDVFPEDRDTPLRPLVRIVPTLSIEQLKDAANRIKSFKKAIEAGQDIPTSPPLKDGPTLEGKGKGGEITQGDGPEQQK